MDSSTTTITPSRTCSSTGRFFAAERTPAQDLLTAEGLTLRRALDDVEDQSPRSLKRGVALGHRFRASRRRRIATTVLGEARSPLGRHRRAKGASHHLTIHLKPIFLGIRTAHRARRRRTKFVNDQHAGVSRVCRFMSRAIELTVSPAGRRSFMPEREHRGAREDLGEPVPLVAPRRWPASQGRPTRPHTTECPRARRWRRRGGFVRGGARWAAPLGGSADGALRTK